MIYMPQVTLRFLIRQDGLVQESVEGATGQACNQITKKLEDALGVVQQKQTTSAAFIQSSKQSITNPAEIH